MPLVQPTITDSADGLLHMYRLVALNQALYQGTLFPRWLPDLAFGYGLPLFIFYAPLSYYIALVLNLPGLGAIGALNASFSLALLLAGTGVYLFVKDLFGPKAGVLAGMAYVYAPVHLLNTLARGRLPAVWAVAIFPFAFWAFGRLIRGSARERTFRDLFLPVSAFLLGVALLMHNISSLLFMPLLGLYVGIELLARSVRPASTEKTKPAVAWQRLILPAGLAGVLGLSLAAFFLVPAIIEKDFVQAQRVIITPDFDFRFNFVTLEDLLGLPQPANTGLLNPSYPLTMGLTQVGLAAVGLLSLLLRPVRGWLGNRPTALPFQRSTVAFAIISLAGIIFMMLAISAGVWERLPLIAFVQHPHRLLSLAAFGLAILVGLAVAALPERPGFWLTVGGIILIFVTTLPLLYPRYHDQLPAKPTLLDMMAYEHASGTIGTTSFGEYLPVWVKQIPRESLLEPMYQTGTTIERLDSAYLPQGTKIESANYGFNQVELIINAPEPYQAIFHTFYFPGWEALIDGQPGSIAPVSERGLIGVSMPAGRHHLQLRFRETPLRLAANTLSIVALIAILATLIFSFISNLSPLRMKVSGAGGRQSAVVFNGRQLTTLAGLALILIFTKAFYLDRFDTLFKHTFDGVHVTGTDVSQHVNFGGQINLLGYDLDRQVVVPGQNFKLTAFWQARQPLTTNYSSLAQLVDAERHLYAGQDNLHPGELRTTRWQSWGFVQDPHAILVPPGTPPGDYFLVTGLYDPVTWARLPVMNGGDPGWSDVVAIPVTVARPSRPPSIAELDIAWPATIQTAEVLETSAAPEIRLLGATPERGAILRNDFLRVAIFWEAIAVPMPDYQVSLRLLASDDTVATQEASRPSHNRYPAPRWTAGERVRDNHALWIPPDFPAGMYRLQLQLLDEAGLPVGEWIELGTMRTAE